MGPEDNRLINEIHSQTFRESLLRLLSEKAEHTIHYLRIWSVTKLKASRKRL